MRITVIDAKDAKWKDEAIQSAVTAMGEGRAIPYVWVFDSVTFESIQDSPIAYRAPWGMLRAASRAEVLSNQGFIAHQGNGAATRFHRLIWEVSTQDLARGDWMPMAHGTKPQPFQKNTTHVFWWKDNGAECKADVCCRYPYLKGNFGFKIQAEDYYGLPGIAYGKRTNQFTAQILPKGHLFTFEGTAIHSNSEGNPIWSVLAFLNSRLARYWLNSVCAEHKAYNYLNQLPVTKSIVDDSRLGELARAGWRERMMITRCELTSPYFARPSLIEAPGKTLAEMVAASASILAQHEAAVTESLRQADELCFDLLGISHDERQAIILSDVRDITIEAGKDQSHPEDESETDEAEESAPTNLVDELIDYGLGVVLGCWDIRFATGEKPAVELPDPFAALPVCPPGMLQNAEGLPAAPIDVPNDYPLRIPWSGILVDDEGHGEDIEHRFREALRVVWGPRADAIEAEACEILGVRTLRENYRKPTAFFADHLKRYSKSRRQAPIYWPLSTSSGSYMLWLYYHRLSDQTLYTCVNDFVDPKLKQVSNEASRLRQKRGRSSAEEKALEQLAGLEIELTDFRAELLRIAAFWKPNLNDGVQITAAPLWRLFQHRPWQKTLKETWESLERSEYDWAHLAMSIWPERVVPKCVTDRSLAIAHDLENLFWVEDSGRWRNLGTPDEEIAEQKQRQQRPGRDQLRLGLAALTLGEGRGLRCEQVYEALATGRWDDLAPALLLWPERVAQKCWDDPLLAVTLKIDLPTKRTKAARERFKAERTVAGCPDLADALREALAGRVDRFASLWAELTRGDRDELALALALWPERVVDECAQDVELAGRHGLRRFLWVQDGRGEWRRRKKPNEEVRDEVMRRESRI